jgi:uncharacterized protein (DUF305 family)
MMGDMGMMPGMHATEPMTGTMPMMAGDMDMMAHMMGMMSGMQSMIGNMGMMGEMDMMHGMMGGEPVTATVPLTESATSADDADAASLPSQTIQAGMVSVTVQPLNLGAEGVDKLEFEVKLETHTGSLEEDLSELAMLRAGDAEVAASVWNAPSGGHHIVGILSFPAVDENGEPILAGATEVSLIFSDLAGAGEQVLTWDLAGAEMGDTTSAEAARAFDAQFIDSMIEHHQGAIAMAEHAQGQAEHAELRDMADAVIAAQTEEIGQMREWRQAWYPELPSTGGMTMGMGEMTISALTDIPFDQRFIDAMISHHQSAIEMAQAAQTEAEHAEIKELAGAIITAQQAEVAQMQGWLKAWYE